MRSALLCLLLALILPVHAAEVRLALFEAASKRTTFHVLNPETGAVASATEFAGSVLSGTNRFVIENYQLHAARGGPALMEATEILAQALFNGFDVLVVREEYNSFSNPLRWLSALAGHPVQVSTILWVVVKDGTVLHRIQLQHEPASYRWNASLFEPPKLMPPQ